MPGDLAAASVIALATTPPPLALSAIQLAASSGLALASIAGLGTLPATLAAASQLRIGMTAALADSGISATDVVIDLRHVDYIDSEGLGSLIQAYTSCRRRGTAIVFAHVFGKNLQLLKTTKLLTVFEVYSTGIEAQRAAASMTSAAFSATM